MGKRDAIHTQPVTKAEQFHDEKKPLSSRKGPPPPGRDPGGSLECDTLFSFNWV